MLVSTERNNKIESKKNITYEEAKERVSFMRRGAFAKAARRGVAPTETSKEVQVSP